jgi:hypothetical protein
MSAETPEQRIERLERSISRLEDRATLLWTIALLGWLWACIFGKESAFLVTGVLLLGAGLGNLGKYFSGKRGAIGHN